MLRNRLAQLREERAEGGFTLIELLVVVVIIGILIAIAIPLYLNYEKGANDKAAQSDLRGAVSALEQCNANAGSYPASWTAVTGSTTAYNPCSGQTVNLSTGTAYKYIQVGSGTSYVLATSNSGGSGAVYCYDSANGGSVKNVSSATVTVASNATSTTC